MLYNQTKETAGTARAAKSRAFQTRGRMGLAEKPMRCVYEKTETVPGGGRAGAVLSRVCAGNFRAAGGSPGVFAVLQQG